jgi:hypothetical protein
VRPIRWHPKRQRGVRACVAVGEDGVTLYGNKATFRALANWMTWIAASKPSEHYECHVVWHLLSRVAKRPNVFVRFDKPEGRSGKRRRGGRQAFELTFMQVEAADLDRLERKGLTHDT